MSQAVTYLSTALTVSLLLNVFLAALSTLLAFGFIKNGGFLSDDSE